MPFCGNCGRKMADTDRFCAECGSPNKAQQLLSKTNEDSQLVGGQSHMAKLKIVSNPYQKNTIIQKWDVNEDSWIELSYENSSNSALVSDAIHNDFFQFKVDEIVDAIVSDYHNQDEKIVVVFEGTEDDYKVLERVVNSDKYSGDIELEKSEVYLENASRVLPKIRTIFKQLEPLVEHCVINKEEVGKEMQKFTEASNDYIPVVVLGNYSSGKSTFINSLLGSEVLPSGDEPVTAKIYKIMKEEDDDRASVGFSFHDTIRVDVTFTSKTSRVKTSEENEISKLLKDGLNEVKDEDVLVRLGKALSIVNSYENDTEEQEISDLIEVTVPFNNGMLAESDSKYVIFDTPGSNSASNGRHLDVLKRAMKDMSNGIPMFVSEYNTLDSTDNEKLYTWINDMAELDSRFTMIIVNKADNAGLPPDGFDDKKIKQILNWSVPKNLYSEGVFFVSSIMGLGSKTNGEFQNYNYYDTYDAQEKRYKDPTSRIYKSLYKYNIMPKQLKEACNEQAAGCDNLIYANSGLYSIEQGLEAFAKEYSSYNKCEQSKLFLRRIMAITDEVISKRVSKSKTDKDNMLKTLEKNKVELLKKIDDKVDSLSHEFDEHYTDFIEDIIQERFTFITAEELKSMELEVESKHQSEMNVEEYDTKLSDAKEALVRSVKAGMYRDANTRNVSRLGRNFSDGIKDIKERRADLKATNREIDRRVSEDLIQLNKERFMMTATERKKSIESASRDKWSLNANRVRRELAEIIIGTDALNEEQRETLRKIIIEYGDINFESKADEIFIKADFVFALRLGSIVIGDAEKIRLDKLRRTFNAELNKYINDICKQIQTSHTESFKMWLAALLADVRDNITDYSSELHTQVDYIKQEEEFIADFETKQKLIKEYSDEVESMISWKERA